MTAMAPAATPASVGGVAVEPAERREVPRSEDTAAARVAPPLVASIAETPSLATLRMALVALAVTVVWVGTWYWPTAVSMVRVWMHSETFAHGFVVPPIALWLAWRKRDAIAAIAPRPAGWALPALALAGAVWLVGDLAVVDALTQFALVAMLVLCVPAVLGARAARVLAFPLGFLFFAVPAGEFVVPIFMRWTADFTVSALAASGIPVYREGLLFVIPSGTWSVVEACSGVRYLIASAMVGTLFAYLSYRSLKRRLLFVAFALAVPVIANWLRAYMIVMIGHLSGNRLAVGVDHLIYGWVFFGVVITIMFWVGARWREDHLPEPAANVVATQAPATGTRLWSMVCAAAILTAAWPLLEHRMTEAASRREAQVAPLSVEALWPVRAQAFTEWRPHFERPNAVLDRQFDGAAPVGLYIAHYRDQSGSRKLVSTNNFMASSEESTWRQLTGGAYEAHTPAGARDVRTFELLDARSRERIFVWEWYWISGHATASDYRAKALTALARLTGQGDDSAAVVLYTRAASAAEADTALGAFLRDHEHAIDAGLARTRAP